MADVSRLTANINRILNLAKLESKLYELKPVKVDLVRMTEEFSRESYFCRSYKQFFDYALPKFMKIAAEIKSASTAKIQPNKI